MEYLTFNKKTQKYSIELYDSLEEVIIDGTSNPYGSFVTLPEYNDRFGFCLGFDKTNDGYIVWANPGDKPIVCDEAKPMSISDITDHIKKELSETLPLVHFSDETLLPGDMFYYDDEIDDVEVHCVIGKDKLSGDYIVYTKPGGVIETINVTENIKFIARKGFLSPPAFLKIDAEDILRNIKNDPKYGSSVILDVMKGSSSGTSQPSGNLFKLITGEPIVVGGEELYKLYKQAQDIGAKYDVLNAFPLESIISSAIGTDIEKAIKLFNHEQNPVIKEKIVKVAKDNIEPIEFKKAMNDNDLFVSNLEFFKIYFRLCI